MWSRTWFTINVSFPFLEAKEECALLKNRRNPSSLMLLPEPPSAVSTPDTLCHGSELTSHIMPVLPAVLWQPFYSLWANFEWLHRAIPIVGNKDSSLDFPKTCFPPECLHYPGQSVENVGKNNLNQRTTENNTVIWGHFLRTGLTLTSFKSTENPYRADQSRIESWSSLSSLYQSC